MAAWCLNNQGNPFPVKATKKGQGKLSCDVKGTKHDLFKIGQKYYAVHRPPTGSRPQPKNDATKNNVENLTNFIQGGGGGQTIKF